MTETFDLSQHGIRVDHTSVELLHGAKWVARHNHSSTMGRTRASAGRPFPLSPAGVV